MTIKTIHAGHGGKNGFDPGAVGSGYTEADIARRITAKMIQISGAKDTSDNSATTVNGNLGNIVQNVNAFSGATEWNISNHLNGATPAATGAEVYYFSGDAEAKAMAARISATIASVLQIPDRGAKAGDGLYVIRNTTGKMLLIEWGFITNPNDVNRLMQNFDTVVTAVTNLFGYSGGAVTPPNLTAKQLTRYWVGWNVGKDFTKIQEYRVNMNRALKIDYLDIFYFQDDKGDWRIGVDNLDHNGLENYRLRLMKAYGLSASQMEGKSHEVDSYLFGYKDITLEQLQNIRVRWTRQLGVDESRLSQRQANGKHSIFVGSNSFREIQHWMVGQNQANADMNISDKRYYELEK